MRRRLSLLLVPLVAGVMWAVSSANAGTLVSNAPYHYIANEDGSYSTTAGLGYNVHDVSSYSVADTIPGQGLYWTGLGRCPDPTSAAFQSFVNGVDAHATDSKILGYFVSDEPQDTSAACVAGLKAEVDAIHAANPNFKTMIVLTGSSPTVYTAFRPAATDTDWIGIDPYPCNLTINGCDYTKIDQKVALAENNGIPQDDLVPVFQAFGDSYYKMPSVWQTDKILQRWRADVPNPPMEYTYSWGCQSGSLNACLGTRRTKVQAVYKAYNQ